MARNFFLYVLVAVTLAFSSKGQAFDRAAWLADFEQLKSAITENYPNFEWAAERGLDLVALESRARDRLKSATSEMEARAAFERFLNNFGDGHLSLTWPTALTAAKESAPSPAVCRNLGYRETNDTSSIAKDLPGYKELRADGGVAAGMLEVAGKRVAILRIPLFQPSLAMCEAAAQKIGKETSDCDETCKVDIAGRSDDIFMLTIEDRIRLLTGERSDMLLVDVAGNGGGNDTAIAVARMLGGKQLLAPAIGLVRNADRARDIAEDITALERALPSADRGAAKFLHPLLANLGDARLQAGQRCDLSALWQGRPANCTNLIRGPFFAGGLIAEELPQQFRNEAWAEQVSSTARLTYTFELWKKPVVVLVDGNSASATELFVAMLQDSRRATIVGAPTLGAGCGWTLPKHEVTLVHSEGKLQMPDCARFRLDGRNELDGIQPDKLVGFRRYDSAKQRAARLGPTLERLVLEVATRRN